MAIRTEHLPSGLTVVTESMAECRSVAAGYWVGLGSRDEPAAQAGASHFLEHLLFKGTDSRSALAIAELIDGGGGDMNAFTTKEYTAYYVRMLAEQTDDALDLLADIVWHPALLDDDIEVERDVILEEILQHGDESDDEVFDVLAAAMYPGHPLGREVLGDEDTINGIGPEAIRAFHRDWYRPCNVVVAVAGAIDHDRVVARIAAGVEGLAGGSSPTRRPPVAPGAGCAVRTKDTEQAHVAIGMAAPDALDDRRHAMTVIDQILGGGLSSRLFQEVRERRALAYSVYSYRAAATDAGMLGVYVGTAPERVPEVLEVVHGELDRMAAGGVTAHELDLAKRHLRGATALGLEDSGARMSRIGRSQMVHGRVPDVDAVLARYDRVSLDDCAALAAEVLGGPRLTAAIGPIEERDVKGALR